MGSNTGTQWTFALLRALRMTCTLFDMGEPRNGHEDLGGPLQKGKPMKAQQGNVEHHVVGPVHVLALHDDDADAIASALVQERDQCSAARVIIDITAFDGSMSIVLEGAEKSGWDHDIMIRTSDQDHLTLEDLRTQSGQTAS